MILQAVIDTSVLVSSVLKPQSIPSQAFILASCRYELIASTDTLRELAQVLARDKLEKFRSRAERVAFFEHYRAMVKLCDVTTVVADCRDPKDDKFLSLALSAGASTIVSGDADLLVLTPYRGIRILTPQEFLSSP